MEYLKSYDFLYGLLVDSKLKENFDSMWGMYAKDGLLFGGGGGGGGV